MWDEYKQEDFNLRALLFVTINDWPALSNLSGQSNKGYRVCTHCLEDTDSIWLTHYRKCVYMGHRRFLPVRHQVRRKGKHFKGQADHRTKPMHRTGNDVFEMVLGLLIQAVEEVLNNHPFFHVMVWACLYVLLQTLPGLWDCLIR